METLLVIDMQNDFLKPGGKLYSNGIERVIPYSVTLINEFKKSNLPIITTMDSHLKNDPEFNLFPPHCIEGTIGHNLIDEVSELICDYKNHHILKKSHYSAFFDTNFDIMIKALNLNEFHVAGVVSNICVLFTVEELRNRGFRVFVHKNAVYSYSKELHDFALSQMKDVLGAEVV